MTTPNELRLLAQRLREHNDNPHHINPMSERFSELVNEATETLSSLASSLAALDNCGQVMGRVHRGQDGSVVCALNSLGRELPDNAKLFADPSVEPVTVGETDAESRAAWIAVVLQKYPEASIRVANQLGVANAPNGMAIGNWMPGAWSVK